MIKAHLDFQQCELLSLFKEHQTLSGMALALNMDKGQLSRSLKRISDSAPVLIKVLGKWTLTDQGEKIVEWYKRSLVEQNIIMERKRELSIVTTQTLSERKLSSLASEITNLSGYESLRIITSLSTIETDILSGKVDLALVCSIPEHPEIRYKKTFRSLYQIVMPYKWKENGKDLYHLLSLPYISHTGMDVRQLLQLEETIHQPAIKYDHLSGVRQAVINGQGWAILPQYAIETEIKEKKLKLFDGPTGLSAIEEFQLWWLPGKMDKKIALKICSLLSPQVLS